MYSAHYDHIGYLPAVDGDSIANGADDNASGTAAVIELARIFAKEKTNNKPLWFVAFAAEEMGLYGSQALVDTIEYEFFEGVINIEMIGKPNDDLGSSSAYISGYDLSYWPDKMSNIIPLDEFMFFPDPYPQMQLFMRSDNASFVKYGIAAHSISTYSENDETYHQVNDDIDKIDFENMKVVIDAIYRASTPLLQLDYDPGKIDYQIKTDR
jgi:Zn-dependent M28 family amino/carboxypeptidase